MQKSLLIAGAGANQIGIFRTARTLGIETIGVDGNSEAPGLAEADQAETANILDADAIVAVARKFDVDALYAAAELSVEPVALASAQMGLPGISPEVATRARDKFRMREALQNAGLPNPLFGAATSAEAAAEAAERVGFPCIVKPADSNSSKGVRRVENSGDVRDAFDNALRYARGKTVLIEEWLDGEEYCIDGLMYRGEYRLGGITGKEISPFPHRFDLGIFMPPMADEETCRAIEGCAADALKAIGMTDGTTHIEVIVADDGPRIVEIAARPGGGRIPTDLINLVYGLDFMADCLRVAVGDEPIERRRFEHGAALYWFPALAGVVTGIEGIDAARAIPAVREIVFQTKAGDVLAPLVDCVSRDRVGYVLTAADDVHDAVRAAKQALDVCTIHTREQVSLS